MTTLAQFRKRCNELNVMAEDNGYGLTINPPNGKVFSSYGTHYESLFYYDGWTKSQMYDEFIHIMVDGVEDCTEVDCEYCNS